VVLLEAMAAGAPVVASRVGGIVDVVEHERTGLLVEPENPDALALAVIRVVSDASLADRLTAAGRQSIEERFSWGKIAERFDELFHRVAGV
jgi:glycosyltransferase involved in cell wall biosynthesis